MVIKYYLTHFKEIPNAFITSMIIIIFAEVLFSKRFYYIIIFGILCFLSYCGMYYYDLSKYNNFRKEMLGIN